MRPVVADAGKRVTSRAVSVASSNVAGRRCRFTNNAGAGAPFPSPRFVATISASAMPVSAENARSRLPDAAMVTTVMSV